MPTNYYASEYTLQSVDDHIVDLNNNIEKLTDLTFTFFSAILLTLLILGIEKFFDTCLNSRK